MLQYFSMGFSSRYYVDGQSLGMKRGRARGTIGVVGNSRGCRVSWGTLAMFHACLFIHVSL